MIHKETNMFDVDDIIAGFADLPDDGINPIVGSYCLYTDTYDETKHCIAGQILVNFGLECPDSSVIASFEAVAQDANLGNVFTPNAIEFITQLQVLADNSHIGGANPRYWGEVKEMIIDDGYASALEKRYGNEPF